MNDGYTSLLRTLLYSIHADKLFPQNGGVLIAVSGGLDSVVLLHALCQLRSEWAGIQWCVATLDHAIRPEGAQDAQFVAELCQAWQIPCVVGRVDVPSLAHTRQQSLETAARQARYAFLHEVATTRGASCVVTAHHADDQAETILMHLVRGAGVEGAMGMKPVSPFPIASAQSEIKLVRPLLRVSRDELVAYAHQHALSYREDATNADTRYLRNYIRHVVWQALDPLNPHAKRALTRFSEVLAVEHDFITHTFTQDILPHITQTPTRWTIPRGKFSQWHEAHQRHTLLKAYQAVHSGEEPLSQGLLLKALQLLKEGITGNQLALTDGVRVRLSYRVGYVEQSDSLLPNEDFYLLETNAPLPLTLESTCYQGDWAIRLSRVTDGTHQAQFCVPVSVGNTWQLRPRQTGDKLSPLGMRGNHKRLKALMIDRKIPRHVRDSVPILTVNGQIISVILPDEWVIDEAFSAQQAIDTDFEKIYGFIVKVL